MKPPPPVTRTRTVTWAPPTRPWRRGSRTAPWRREALLGARPRLDGELRALEGDHVVEGLVEGSLRAPADELLHRGDVRRAPPKLLEALVVGLFVVDES